MPHAKRHRTQHCAVRTLSLAVAAGQRSRGHRRKCEARLGCTIEYLVQRLGIQAHDKRHLDHIVPLSDGGSEHFTNYRMLPALLHMARQSKATDEEQAAVALLEMRYPASIFFAKS